MVLITHSGENAEKTDTILKVAQKRFGLYGLEKTTMKEIASDLNMSKASLYYYFPDKVSLFRAVMELEQNEFFHMVEQTLQTLTNPSAMFKEYNRIRLSYFKTFFNLGRLKREEFSSMKPLFQDVLNNLTNKEIKLIENIIIYGNEKGIFHSDNVTEMAALFIEIIKGLRMQVIHRKELLYIEQEEYEALEYKLSIFTSLFIRGLAYNKLNDEI
jgi:AcrR family transcriptional regulator